MGASTALTLRSTAHPAGAGTSMGNGLRHGGRSSLQGPSQAANSSSFRARWNPKHQAWKEGLVVGGEGPCPWAEATAMAQPPTHCPPQTQGHKATLGLSFSVYTDIGWTRSQRV